MKEKFEKTNQQMQSEHYLKEIFSVMHKAESLNIVDKKARFNSTELRLIGEVLNAKYQGKRMISTQLAKILGVTRSAISQIVNRLEMQGVVKRVADDVDRKIAYIELTEDALAMYDTDLKVYDKFINQLVAEFGVERFHMMCASLGEFCDLLEVRKNSVMLENN